MSGTPGLRYVLRVHFPILCGEKIQSLEPELKQIWMSAHPNLSLCGNSIAMAWSGKKCSMFVDTSVNSSRPVHYI